VPAAAQSLDVLAGKFAFNWRSEPAREKCVKVRGALMAAFKAGKYRCNVKPVTNTSTGAPARICTQTKGKEYLIFETRKACENERKDQASNE
jgi:hypothetical protein